MAGGNRLRAERLNHPSAIPCGFEVSITIAMGRFYYLVRGIRRGAVRGRQVTQSVVLPLLFWWDIKPVARVVSRQPCHQKSITRVFAGRVLPRSPHA